MVDERDISLKPEHEYERAVLSVLPRPETPNQDFPATLLIASETGQAQSLVPVAKFLQLKEVPVFIKSLPIAEKVFINIPGKETILELPNSIGWAIATPDVPNSFVVKSLEELKRVSPEAKICITSAGPYDMTSLLKTMFDAKITPDLVLPNTREQVRVVCDLFSKQTEDLSLDSVPVIPVGNAGFDKLLAPWTKSGVAREKLENPSCCLCLETIVAGHIALGFAYSGPIIVVK